MRIAKVVWTMKNNAGLIDVVFKNRCGCEAEVFVVNEYGGVTNISVAAGTDYSTFFIKERILDVCQFISYAATGKHIENLEQANLIAGNFIKEMEI